MVRPSNKISFSWHCPFKRNFHWEKRFVTDGVAGGWGECSQWPHQTRHGVFIFFISFVRSIPRTVSITADIDIIFVTITYFSPLWYRAGESGFGFFPICTGFESDFEFGNIVSDRWQSRHEFYLTVPSFLILMFVFKHFHPEFPLENTQSKIYAHIRLKQVHYFIQ